MPTRLLVFRSNIAIMINWIPSQPTSGKCMLLLRSLEDLAAKALTSLATCIHIWWQFPSWRRSISWKWPLAHLIYPVTHQKIQKAFRAGVIIPGRSYSLQPHDQKIQKASRLRQWAFPRFLGGGYMLVTSYPDHPYPIYARDTLTEQ